MYTQAFKHYSNRLRAPSCEFLDQMEAEKSILCDLDEYAQQLMLDLAALEISEEDRVTIAEGFAETDLARSGSIA